MICAAIQEDTDEVYCHYYRKAKLISGKAIAGMKFDPIKIQIDHETYEVPFMTFFEVQGDDNLALIEYSK